MRIRLRRVGFCVLVLGVAFAALPLLAQDQSLEAQMSQQTQASELLDPDKVKAIDSPLWREMGLNRAALPSKLTDVLSEANLKALAAGADPATVETMSGESVAEVLVLGSIFDEFVYTAVTPCRLVDTITAVGAFAGGETRNYNLIGPANYAPIGGNAAGCNIPGNFNGPVLSFNDVRALNLNYIAVAPGGPGDFRAWPTNQAVPLASVLNYANVGGGLNIANGLATTTCDAICLDLIAPFTCGDPCPAGDLSVRADVSGTHLIIDVYGFFTAATTAGVDGASSTGENAAPPAINDGACHEIESCSITNNSSSTQGVIVMGNVNVIIDHTVGTHDEMAANISTTSASCDAAFALDPGSGSYDVHSTHPTACCFNGTISVMRRFTLAANTSETYYLNFDMSLGASALDSIDSVNLICILDP